MTPNQEELAYARLAWYLQRMRLAQLRRLACDEGLPEGIRRAITMEIQSREASTCAS